MFFIREEGVGCGGRGAVNRSPDISLILGVNNLTGRGGGWGVEGLYSSCI